MKHLRVGVLAGLMLLAMLLGMAGGDEERLAAAEPGRPTHFSAYLGLLPGLIDSNGTGPFVDLVKAIAGLDDGVEVSVMVYPMSRATRSVVVGEADFTLRKMGLTNIHRVYFGEFDDVFIIPKGPKGDAVDRFLTQSIEWLRASGQLDKIYSAIHAPYQEWQPGENAATKAVRAAQ